MQLIAILTEVQKNPALLERTLYDVSTPGHPSYGKHLKHQELKRVVAASSHGRSEILRWLQQSGATIAKDNGHAIEVLTSL
jgi:tripeptidyl-peptidase-1